MTRIVFCKRLNRDAPGLVHPPYPGKLGEAIYNSISQSAWQEWLALQTAIINENRLNVLDREARAYLETEMQKYLFEGSDEKPAGFKPISK